MKKLLAILLTLAMSLSLAACGGTEDGGDSSGESACRVAMICDSSISDGGWGMSCYNACLLYTSHRHQSHCRGWAHHR